MARGASAEAESRFAGKGASAALANGVPTHEVSRWLGHKSIKATVDIYGHMVPEAWDLCRDVMKHVMRPAVEGAEESVFAV